MKKINFLLATLLVIMTFLFLNKNYSLAYSCKDVQCSAGYHCSTTILGDGPYDDSGKCIQNGTDVNPSVCTNDEDCINGYTCVDPHPNDGSGGSCEPINSQIQTGKCNCTTAYGACGNYFGYTNIKYRACTASSTGAFTCTVVNGVSYNYVSCAGGTTVPTATPTPTTPASTAVQNCGVCSSNAGKSTCFVRWTDPNGGCDSDFLNNRVEDCNAATSRCPVVAPTTSPLNCNVCSTLPGKSSCRVKWIDPIGGCDSNFNNNRIEDCSATSGCPASILATPVPTSGNPACVCNTANTCDTSCTFDKFSDVTSYGNPVKCSQDPNVLASTPTADQKNGWCKSSLRTKGDVDGNGIINNFDYFYYVAAVNGGKIPASANADVDGDGLISTLDRAIIIRSQPAN